VIKFVSDLWQISTPVSYTNNSDRHEKTDILVKVALNTITITLNSYNDLTCEWVSASLGGYRRISVRIYVNVWFEIHDFILSGLYGPDKKY
jgi:hypothetical protein